MLLCTLWIVGQGGCRMVPWVRPLIWSVFRNEAYCHHVDQRSQGNQCRASQVGVELGRPGQSSHRVCCSSEVERVVKRIYAGPCTR